MNRGELMGLGQVNKMKKVAGEKNSTRKVDYYLLEFSNSIIIY